MPKNVNCNFCLYNSRITCRNQYLNWAWQDGKLPPFFLCQYYKYKGKDEHKW